MIVTSRKTRFDTPLKLEGGGRLSSFEIAYETYGELAEERDNAVLVCHGLTADQHAAGRHTAGDPRPGWWDAAIGPGKAIDTERYYVICSNVLGGFSGSTGPSSTNPLTGRPYGLGFPVVTIGDMVVAQAHLIERLGIHRLHAVIGGCMGGFQVLKWMHRFPQQIGRALIISATHRVSAHTIALWSVLREAIRLDPDWADGDYYGLSFPRRGMGLMARIGVMFQMRREQMQKRFGLKRVTEDALSYGFDADFEVEAFLQRIGINAGQRIDPNAFFYLTRAMDYFDLTRDGASLTEVFADWHKPTQLISYDSDWRYPPAETETLREALSDAGAPVQHTVLDSPFGHGAFVYDFEGAGKILRNFLDLK